MGKFDSDVNSRSPSSADPVRQMDSTIELTCLSIFDAVCMLELGPQHALVFLTAFCYFMEKGKKGLW